MTRDIFKVGNRRQHRFSKAQNVSCYLFHGAKHDKIYTFSKPKKTHTLYNGHYARSIFNLNRNIYFVQIQRNVLKQYFVWSNFYLFYLSYKAMV